MTPTVAPGVPLWQRFVTSMLLLALHTSATIAGQDLPPEVEQCLECHAEAGLALTFDDGSEIDLQVDATRFLDSVHGSELFCTDCHQAYDDDHPFNSWGSRREYVLAAYDLCKTCHFDTYARTLDSVHYANLADGSNEIPVCSDCHGAHEIESPLERHALMSSRCGSCHKEVYAEYEKSAHGQALSTNGEDLPGCAQCHTAHTIELPGTTKFHLASPLLCIRCHGDTAMMERHGLATTIAETYLSDFHGVSATLADPGTVAPDEVVVVCVDCHGYHDITSTEVLGDEAMRARVEAVCADCHEGTQQDFPAAWLSHYPPSWSHAPLVYLVTIAYRIFIPFLIIGLSLQILLHLYRVGVRR